VAVAVGELDDTLLAALWARAVIAADAVTVAQCELECEARKVTPRGLIAATGRFDATVAQSQKNIAEGKSYDTGFKLPKYRPGEKTRKKLEKAAKGKKKGSGKGGYNPNRKKSGPGGGQFTTADDAQAKQEKAQAQAESKAWDEQEAVRKAQTKADEGNYTSLVNLAEKREAAARKKVDLAKNDQDRQAAQAELEAAQANLADVNKKAADAKSKAEADKNTKRETAQSQREQDAAARRAATAKDAEDRKKVDAQAKAAGDAARQAAIEKNYPAWEAEIRRTHPGANETEINEMVLKDRAQRVRALGADYGKAESEAASRAVHDAAENLPDPGPPAKKMQEDESPATSPNGARLVDFRSDGVAHYADGTTYDGKTWRKNGKVIRASALLAKGGHFNADLHPRGHDGKFIERFGYVTVDGLPGGPKHAQGQVSSIIPDPNDPGNPLIRVVMTDPRWNGPDIVDTHRKQISKRHKPKARLRAEADAEGIEKFIRPEETPAHVAPTPTGPETPAERDVRLYAELVTGGFSEHISDGAKPPKTGFMVSDAGQEEVMDTIDSSPRVIDQYIRDHGLATAPPDVYMGGWTEEDKHYLDVSRHYATLEEGMAAMRANNQIAMYDTSKAPTDPGAYIRNPDYVAPTAPAAA
jgi:chemotaxis protein histidine kinase CheA